MVSWRIRWSPVWSNLGVVGRQGDRMGLRGGLYLTGRDLPQDQLLPRLGLYTKLWLLFPSYKNTPNKGERRWAALYAQANQFVRLEPINVGGSHFDVVRMRWRWLPTKSYPRWVYDTRQGHLYCLQNSPCPTTHISPSSIQSVQEIASRNSWENMRKLGPNCDCLPFGTI